MIIAPSFFLITTDFDTLKIPIKQGICADTNQKCHLMTAIVFEWHFVYLNVSIGEGVDIMWQTRVR